MRTVLGLARRGLGNAWPNPAVGCLIIKDGRVVGRGWTQPGGRPHAEAEALARAGEAARGATAFVSLEPCSHQGRGPPCADALIAAGITRVVAAIEDPDPRVAGTGFAKLREAGIAVDTGVRGAEAEELNAGFFCRVMRGRPLVTLKLATSLDGRIATASGESRWITGPVVRERAHLLRATHDAVLVGTSTALADDPQLTCRLPGLERASPVRIVVDRTLRLPARLKLFAEVRDAPTWVVTSAAVDKAVVLARAQLGVKVFTVQIDETGRIDLAAMLRQFGDEGLTRLLIEGGGTIAAALLRAGLVDGLVWMRAPVAIGGDGVAALAALGFGALADAPRFALVASEIAGGELIETYRRGG